MSASIRPGQSYPLGATIVPGGVNFSVYSKHATAMELLLFGRVDAARPTRVLPLRPTWHRTFDYWHAFVPGLKAGQLYAYRAHGPYVPHEGHRFDAQKVLLDPYGRAVAVPAHYDRKAAARPGAPAVEKRLSRKSASRTSSAPMATTSQRRRRWCSFSNIGNSIIRAAPVDNPETRNSGPSMIEFHAGRAASVPSNSPV